MCLKEDVGSLLEYSQVSLPVPVCYRVEGARYIELH